MKRMNNICNTPELVHATSYVENGGLKLVIKLAKTLTCMAVAIKRSLLN